jgi:hypothetical protein
VAETDLKCILLALLRGGSTPCGVSERVSVCARKREKEREKERKREREKERKRERGSVIT